MSSPLHASLAKIRDAVLFSIEAARAHAAGAVSLPVLETVRQVEQRGSYEDLGAAMSAARDWCKAIGEDRMDRITSATGIDLRAQLEIIDQHDPVWSAIMPNYAVHDDGSATAIPHMMSCPVGSTKCHGLGNAVLYHGVQASVFSRPLKAEPLYDGTEALAAGSVSGLTPLGMAAEYSVCILDGELHHPPLWPSEALKRSQSDPDRETQPEADMEPDF